MYTRHFSRCEVTDERLRAVGDVKRGLVQRFELATYKEVEHRSLRWVWNDLDPIEVRERRRELYGAGDELGHVRQDLVEPPFCRNQERVRGEEPPAVPDLPDPRLVDDSLCSGQRGSGWRAEVLVERDVHRVEQVRDLVEVAVVERSALPEARAVQVERDLAFSCLGAESR
jgi:hypothetical protein